MLKHRNITSFQFEFNHRIHYTMDLNLDLKDRFMDELKSNFGSEKIQPVKKLFIIIPESLNCPPSLTFEDKLIQTKLTVFRSASRAGREARDYTIPIYKLTTEVSCIEFDYYLRFDPHSRVKIIIHQGTIEKLASMHFITQ